MGLLIESHYINKLMRKELELLLENGIENLFEDINSWESLLIDKYPPVIHRLYRKISDNRTVILHKLHHSGTESCLMHSHSWAFALCIVKGGYEMGMGFSKDRNQIPETIFQMQIKEGDIYEMTSSDVWHYTKPLLNELSYSVMLVGDRWRERKAENNEPLGSSDKEDIFNYFKSKFNGVF